MASKVKFQQVLTGFNNVRGFGLIVERQINGRGIEEYHRGIKQCCGVERAHVRNATAITTHILMSLRAFIRLEVYRLRTRISWYEAKTSIIRDAIHAYLARPLYPLSPTA